MRQPISSDTDQMFYDLRKTPGFIHIYELHPSMLICHKADPGLLLSAVYVAIAVTTLSGHRGLPQFVTLLGITVARLDGRRHAA